jgi:predicted RNase H-like nuclease
VDDEGFVGARTGSLPELIGWAEPVAVIGVDIPIGDVAGGVRRADVEARRFVGPRGASVFAAPPAEALGAPSCAEANATLRTLGVPMLSRQAWALVPKMQRPQRWRRWTPVVEVHPEVSFRAGRRTPAVVEEVVERPAPAAPSAGRGRHLLPDVIAEVQGAVADDVVDAAVVAWSARRIAAGTASTLPDPPEDSDGRAVAIWY